MDGCYGRLGCICAMAGAIISLMGMLAEAKSMQWNFLGMAFFYALIAAFCCLRRNWSKKPLDQKIESVRRYSAGKRDAVLSTDGYQEPGCCWECDKALAHNSSRYINADRQLAFESVAHFNAAA